MEKDSTIILGVDVGGTKVCIGLVRSDGEVLQKLQYPMRYMAIADWTEQLKEKIAQLTGTSSSTQPFCGIGFAFRGIVDYQSQILRSCSLLALDAGFNLCAELRRYYGVPVYIENDVKAATIAEIQYGIGRKYPSFGCINVGTGLGLGIVCDGVLWHGSANCAGEIGTCPLIRRDGNLDRLENLVSGMGIGQEAQRRLARFPQSVLSKGDEIIDGRTVFSALKKNDPLAKSVVDDFTYALALQMANLESTLNLGHYVFIGSVASNSQFMSALRTCLKKLTYPAFRWTASLNVTDIGAAEVGLKGAASLFLYSSGRIFHP
ncbi:putative sugar kinase [Oscillibacter valericigenes Sjm18-20]|nr:putative sugar kinase [Oscillibacter valericigenes Sjm18-20]